MSAPDVLAAKTDARVRIARLGGVAEKQIAVVDGVGGGRKRLEGPAGLPPAPRPDAFADGNCVGSAIGDVADAGTPGSPREDPAAAARDAVRILKVLPAAFRSRGRAGVGLVADIEGIIAHGDLD